MGHFLLTGCTGLVGRYLVRELLEAGTPLAVLIRSTKFESAVQRLDSVMRYWEQQGGYALPRPIVLEGELNSPGLGLSQVDRQWLSQHCESVVHCGASMVFREDQHGEPFRTNVEGVKNLLQLCRESSIRKFHHVSTVYICGLREGRVLESEVDFGQQLGNVYEQSKLRAEKLVREADFLEQVTVYRPASVVGDSRTGYVTSSHGFYLPLQLAYIVADKINVRDMNQRFMNRLGLKGHEGKNLVPVDWLAKAISAIVKDPNLHCQTYHLASHRPVPVALIQQVIQNAIEAYHPRALRSSGDEDVSAYESQFQEYMRVYQSHWRDDPKFDLQNTRQALPHLPCPEFDAAALMRIARYPIEHKFNLSQYEHAEHAYDVAGRLRNLVEINGNGHHVAENPQRLNIQVNGRGGGQWQLLLSDGRVCGIERGLAHQNDGMCYLTSTTLRSLVERHLSVTRSIAMGRIVLEGDVRSRQRLTAVLEELAATR